MAYWNKSYTSQKIIRGSGVSWAIECAHEEIHLRLIDLEGTRLNLSIAANDSSIPSYGAIQEQPGLSSNVIQGWNLLMRIQRHPRELLSGFRRGGRICMRGVLW